MAANLENGHEIAPADFDPLKTIAFTRIVMPAIDGEFERDAMPTAYRIQSLPDMLGKSDAGMATDVAENGAARYWMDAEARMDAKRRHDHAVGVVALVQLDSQAARDAALASLGRLREGDIRANGQEELQRAFIKVSTLPGAKVLVSDKVATALHERSDIHLKPAFRHAAPLSEKDVPAGLDPKSTLFLLRDFGSNDYATAYALSDAPPRDGSGRFQIAALATNLDRENIEIVRGAVRDGGRADLALRAATEIQGSMVYSGGIGPASPEMIAQKAAERGEARKEPGMPMGFDPRTALVVTRRFDVDAKGHLAAGALPTSYRIQTFAQMHHASDAEVSSDMTQNGKAHFWLDATAGHDVKLLGGGAGSVVGLIQYPDVKTRDAILLAIGEKASGTNQGDLNGVFAVATSIKLAKTTEVGLRDAMKRPLDLRDRNGRPIEFSGPSAAKKEADMDELKNAAKGEQAQAKPAAIYLTATAREVQAALKPEREALAGDPSPVLKALVAFGQTIEQDQWARGEDGKPKRTGEVKVGSDALRALKDDFGPELYRNVTLNGERAAALANAVPGGVKDLDEAVKRSEARRAAVERQRTSERSMGTKIPVIATIAEVRDAVSALKHGTKTSSKTAEVLSKLANSIEQTQWTKDRAGKPIPTGDFKTGLPALEALRDGFGTGTYRKVELNAIKAEHGLSIVGGALSATFKEVQDLNIARDAEHKAAKAAAQAPSRAAGASR